MKVEKLSDNNVLITFGVNLDDWEHEYRADQEKYLTDNVQEMKDIIELYVEFPNSEWGKRNNGKPWVELEEEDSKLLFKVESKDAIRHIHDKCYGSLRSRMVEPFYNPEYPSFRMNKILSDLFEEVYIELGGYDV